MQRWPTRLLALVLLLAATLVAGQIRRGDDSAIAVQSRQLTVSLVDFAFEPSVIEIPADTEVTITLTNDGSAQHSFVVGALGIDSGPINGGASEVISFEAPVGEYDIVCDIPGHKELGMVGTLRVVAAPDDFAPTIKSIENEVPITPVAAGEPTAQPLSMLPSTEPTVEMSDSFRFAPTDITVQAGEPVTVHLVNVGTANHQFDIDSLGIHSGPIAGGTSKTMIFTILNAGDYEFRCGMPGHTELGEVGTIRVIEAVSRPSDGARLGELETRVAQLETSVAGTPAGMRATPVSVDAGSPPVATPVVEPPPATPADVAPIEPRPVAATPGTTTGAGTRESPASVGQAIVLDGLSVTLLTAAVLPPGAFSLEAESGMVLLSLELRIENAGAGPIPYSPEQVSLKDIVQGYEFADTSYTFLGSNPLQRAELPPGDFVRGSVIVQVDARSTQLLVRFSSESYGQGEQLFWIVAVP